MPSKRTVIACAGAVATAIVVFVLLVPHPFPRPVTGPSSATTATDAASTSAAALPTANAGSHITVLVSGTSYGSAATGSETVLQLMQHLASTTPFSFTEKYYPSLGEFIESINGTQNSHGKYWMLYINGTLSQVGVSSAIVKPGDIVEWKYE